MENTIVTAWQRALDDPHPRNLPYKVETNERGQSISGQMTFYVAEQNAPVERSGLMPAFPHDINKEA